jgi:hypothetical protein
MPAPRSRSSPRPGGVPGDTLRSELGSRGKADGGVTNVRENLAPDRALASAARQPDLTDRVGEGIQAVPVGEGHPFVHGPVHQLAVAVDAQPEVVPPGAGVREWCAFSLREHVRVVDHPIRARWNCPDLLVEQVVNAAPLLLCVLFVCKGEVLAEPLDVGGAAEGGDQLLPLAGDGMDGSDIRASVSARTRAW